jgi:hypothetical protein
MKAMYLAILFVLPNLVVSFSRTQAHSSVAVKLQRRAKASAEKVALQRHQRASLPLHSKSPAHSSGHHPSEYFGTVSVGSPAQEFQVLFDTGSGNLLLASASCDSLACTKHKQLNASLSTTSLNIAFANKPDTPVGDDGDQDVVNLVYGTGEATGVIVQDRVCVGSTCVRLDLVAAIEESEAPFAGAPFDGIFGLGLTPLSEAPAFNLLDCMTRDKTIKHALFSVFLGAMDDEESEILFGSYRPEHVADELTWIPVINGSGFWEVSLDGVSLDGKKIANSSNASAVLDTGTSLLAGPPEIVNALLDQLNIANDCSNLNSLPDIGFNVSGHLLSLSPREYVDQDASGKECTLPLMTQDVKPGERSSWILGDPFLRKYYTVYDREKMQVGLALAARKTQGSASKTTKHLRRH